MRLRVAYPAFEPAAFYDPSKIDTARQANILRNIYSRLVELSPDGELIAGVASSFEWSENSVVFEFNRDFETESGNRIDAEDAALSLKRLLVLSQNTHGRLADFLCPKRIPKTIDQPCSGIKVEDNKLILTVADDSKRLFFVPMLAGLDFAVIPRGSVDWSLSTLPITSYRETSGPYFIAQDSSDGAFLLQANKRHYNYSSKIAQEIEIVPAASDTALSLFTSGAVDLITTVDPMPFSKLVKLSEQNSNFELHRTHDIRLMNLVFTARGRRDLSSTERLCIGRVVRELAAPVLSEDGYKLTDRFFPDLGVGSLKEDQAKSIAKLNSSAITLCPKVKIGFKTVMPSKYRQLLNSSAIEVVELSSSPWRMDIDDQPHAFLDLTDSGFYEDFSLLSYNISVGIFADNEEEGQIWLSDYMNTDFKAERLKKLRALHFNSLAEGRVVPLGLAPYVAIARKPWKFEFSMFYPGTPLWLVKQN